MEYGRGFWLRLLALALLDAVAVYSAIVLFGDEAWLFLAALVVGSTFINWVYLWPRTTALRWTTPGLVFLFAFMVVPILYTVYISFTNYSTGNLITKDQAIDRLESLVLPASDDARAFRVDVVRSGDGVTLLFTDNASARPSRARMSPRCPSWWKENQRLAVISSSTLSSGA